MLARHGHRGAPAPGPRGGVLGTRLGLALTDGRTLGTRSQVLTAQGMSSTALAALVAKDADVEWVQVDHRRFIQAAPNDPLYPNNLSTTVAPNGPAVGQWYLRAPDAAVEDASGTLVISSINIEPAWAITHGSASVVIGDVDTGITTHPELTGSASSCPIFRTAPGRPTATTSSATPRAMRTAAASPPPTTAMPGRHRSVRPRRLDHRGRELAEDRQHGRPVLRL